MAIASFVWLSLHLTARLCSALQINLVRALSCGSLTR